MITHSLTAPLVAIGTFAHPQYAGPFPFSYPTDGETPIFNRGLATRFVKGAERIPPHLVRPYLVTLPFTPSTDAAVTQRKWGNLVRVIREESFDTTAAASRAAVQSRLFVTIGINRARSYDPAIDRAILQWARELNPTTVGFACRTLTTLWETSFVFSQEGLAYKVNADVVQPCFVVLEYLAEPAKVQTAITSFSMDSFRKQIPFTHVREWIKNDTFGLEGFQRCLASPAYLTLMDDDPVAFRRLVRQGDTVAPIGLFSGYDSIVRANGTLPPQLMSTGYYALTGCLGTQLAIKLDMRIRDAISKWISGAPYFPEPGTCVLLSEEPLRRLISFLNKESLDTESRRLITNLRPALAQERIKFVALECLFTEIPQRMHTSKPLASLRIQVVGQKSSLKALRGVSQSFVDPSIFSNNVFMAIPHKGINIYAFKGVFADIFQCFDPLALAQALPKKGNYQWRHFQFLMATYEGWNTYFTPSTSASAEERAAHKTAWGVYAKAAADRIWPNQMTTALYEAGFEAYLERFDKAIAQGRETLKIPDPLLLKLVQAAHAAGQAIFQVFREHLT